MISVADKNFLVRFFGGNGCWDVWLGQKKPAGLAGFLIVLDQMVQERLISNL